MEYSSQQHQDKLRLKSNGISVIKNKPFVSHATMQPS